MKSPAVVFTTFAVLLCSCATVQTVADSARDAFGEVADGVQRTIAGSKSPGEGAESPPEPARDALPDAANAPAATRFRDPLPAWDTATLDTARSVDYLSAVEKDLVLEINKMRSDPARYAEIYLVPRRGSYSGRLYKRPGEIDIMTSEGIRALDECIDEIRRSQPRKPLAPSRGLSLAADDHAADQGRTGGTGHTGRDGSSSSSRMSRYGKWDKLAGENISYGHDEAFEILFQLVVDDGVPSRGHRENLMQQEFGLVGVSIGRHPRFGALCVMDFAGQYTERAR